MFLPVFHEAWTPEGDTTSVVKLVFVELLTTHQGKWQYVIVPVFAVINDSWAVGAPMVESFPS